MKAKYFFYLLFLILPTHSFGQTIKMFSKKVNTSIKTDFYLNPIQPADRINARADFYYDKTLNSGVIIVYDLAHRQQYKYFVNQMSTNVVKGLKVYYFKTTNNKYKISLSKEENGFAIASYSERVLTVYRNE